MTEQNPISPEEQADILTPEVEGESHEAETAAEGGKKNKKAKGDAAKLAALEEKLAGAEAKLAAMDDQMKRLAAEYDNFRRRSREEHDAAFNHGVAYAAETLLPVLDVLENAAKVETTDEEYKKGVVMILDKAREVFAKMGIEEIDAAGKPFDPELHNACMQESCDGIDSGCITRVMQKGYTLGGRVIRHAVVAVAP